MISKTALYSLAFVSLSCVALPAQPTLPPVPYPPENPHTPEKAQLGKALFWDEQVSSSNTVACGTCHRFAAGGADPRSVLPQPGRRKSLHPGADTLFHTSDDIVGSSGVISRSASGSLQWALLFGLEEQVTARHAPTVVNAAYSPKLFWDARAGDVFRDPQTGAVRLTRNAALETQAAGPLLDPVEMAHAQRAWIDLMTRLSSTTPLALATNVPPTLAQFLNGRSYGTIFRQVFGVSSITPDRIAMAIATYERTLIADQTPYDLWRTGRGVFTPAEQRGHALFSGRARCAVCHREPLLTDIVLRNTGVRPWTEDQGGGLGQFKIPDLRNVELSAPYFHNGQAKTLMDVIDFYDRGGDFSVNRDALLQPIIPPLTAAEKSDLLAFLGSLTDPRVATETAPFDRPRLYTESARVPMPYGLGTAGSGNLVPELVALEPSFIGNRQLSIGLRNTIGGQGTLLLLDAAHAQSPIRILGVDIWVGVTAGLVLVPGTSAGSGAGSGYSSTVLEVPSISSLRGTSFYCQWLILDSASPQGVSASGGVSIPVF